MNYYDIIKRTWQDNTLFSALIELTYQCNLDCYICYNDRELDGKSLSLGQYYQLLEDLQTMQVMNLTLSGGEPLAHPNFWEIGTRGRELGFVVRIKSNGHALRQDVIERLQTDIDPYTVEISLHGATATTHDRQTRVVGSFDRLQKNLQFMKQAGLKVQLNCPLTSWLESEVEAMYEFADSFGYSLCFDPHITPRDNGDTEPQSVAPTDEGLLGLYRLQKERGILINSTSCGNDSSNIDSEESKHCGAGSSTVSIDPYGTVYPCVALRRSSGSLHDHSITEIWQGSAALKDIRSLSVEAARNVGTLGPMAHSAGFCPGLSDMLCGDPSVVHAGVHRVARLQQECIED